MKTCRWIVICLSCIAAVSSAVSQESAVNQVYRIPCVSNRGFDVWIVDGNSVRRDIYPEFLYGGNDQRYLFIPEKEIWIDQAISAEEYTYTLEHEICERSLMALSGISYADAHDSALVLERNLRLEDFRNARMHEQRIQKTRPVDNDGLKEITSLPDSISLLNVYRLCYGERDGIKIWIVDGAMVRREIFPDFGFSGNDLAYRFIPEREIWIDGQVTCEETEFSIRGELLERKQISEGVSYDSAYLQSLQLVRSAKKAAFEKAASHPSLKIPIQLDREFGKTQK
jgi:hypothetical protein